MHVLNESELSPKHNTVILIGSNPATNIIHTCRIRSIPFSVIGFEYYESKTPDFSDESDIDGAAWLMQHASRWREQDTSSHVLLPESITMYNWSQMFMCYSRRVGVGKSRREVSSLCGPIGSRYYLTPIDKSVKVYKAVNDYNIKKNLDALPLDISAEQTVPFKDIWEWQAALIISHLYIYGLCSEGEDDRGRDTVFFSR